MFLEEFRRGAMSWGPGKHMVVEERNGLIEAFHEAHIAVVDGSGRILYSSGDPRHIAYTRSCIKPIQALPLLYTGAAEHYALTEKEIAVISGSHSGEPEHLAAVRSILKKAGLDESYLKCHGHVPFNKEQARLIGEDFSSIHDNCSGKHAGALTACMYNGWDLDSYTDFEHPLTREIVRTISSLTGLDHDDVYLGVDGCDIPNFAVPMDSMARLFALLADPGNGPLKLHLATLGRSMMKNPYMVAGTDRFDTILMKDFPNRVLSKAGAVGLQTLSAFTDDDWVGISIKLVDGAYSSALPLVTYHVLSELGIKSTTENRYTKPLVTTRSGKVVGAMHSFGSLKEH
ncbi:MAG: asparaginase [Candidatus Thermoplasmatota archaeon]|nr:asparaginase [Candidatus Thermoplasmatota archaeon]